jgi:hypothetical protein
MVERPRSEPVEVEVEVDQLSYVPGRHVDRLGGARRWWDASPAGAIGQAARAWPTPTAQIVATTVLTGSASFWRVVDVPGDQLGRVLGAWWLRSTHDHGHLCLGEPHGTKGTWQLGGSLRLTSISKRFAVDVHLSPYARYWSLLELTPRRPIRPTRLYFRVGHDSLDLFTATLRNLT